MQHLREEIFGRIRREWHNSIETLLDIMGQERLLQGNPLLERSIRNRFPYLDPLNHVQVELLKEHRAQNPDEQILRGIQLTINASRPACGIVARRHSGWCVSTRPQTRNCASGNLEILRCAIAHHRSPLRAVRNDQRWANVQQLCAPWVST